MKGNVLPENKERTLGSLRRNDHKKHQNLI